MKAVVAVLLGVLVLTGITGHLFSRREATTAPTQPANPHHEALAKLIRTSEDALGWIGNKTIISINNIKNLTASAVAQNSATVVKKNNIWNWLRGVVQFNSSASGAEPSETEERGDSGESVILAHRTPDQGFSWGPSKDTTPGSVSTDPPGPLLAAGRRVHGALSYLYGVSRNLTQRGEEFLQDNSSESIGTDPSGPLLAAGRRVHGAISYLYRASRNMTQRGKDFLQTTIDKVKNVKGSLKATMSKRGEEYVEALLEESPTTTWDLGDPCEDETRNVCAVDWGRNVFTVFQNDCRVRVYNQRHGTNFSIHDSDVCINLLAQHPENYEKVNNPGF